MATPPAPSLPATVNSSSLPVQQHQIQPPLRKPTGYQSQRRLRTYQAHQTTPYRHRLREHTRTTLGTTPSEGPLPPILYHATPPPTPSGHVTPTDSRLRPTQSTPARQTHPVLVPSVYCPSARPLQTKPPHTPSRTAAPRTHLHCNIAMSTTSRATPTRSSLRTWGPDKKFIPIEILLIFDSSIARSAQPLRAIAPLTVLTLWSDHPDRQVWRWGHPLLLPYYTLLLHTYYTFCYTSTAKHHPTTSYQSYLYSPSRYPANHSANQSTEWKLYSPNSPLDNHPTKPPPALPTGTASPPEPPHDPDCSPQNRARDDPTPLLQHRSLAPASAHPPQTSAEHSSSRLRLQTTPPTTAPSHPGRSRPAPNPLPTRPSTSSPTLPPAHPPPYPQRPAPRPPSTPPTPHQTPPDAEPPPRIHRTPYHSQAAPSDGIHPSKTPLHPSQQHVPAADPHSPHPYPPPNATPSPHYRNKSCPSYDSLAREGPAPQIYPPRNLPSATPPTRSTVTRTTHGLHPTATPQTHSTSTRSRATPTQSPSLSASADPRCLDIEKKEGFRRESTLSLPGSANDDNVIFGKEQTEAERLEMQHQVIWDANPMPLYVTIDISKGGFRILDQATGSGI
ncbi:hypothetical protein K458DRAFT_397764 [Lentithecium fluviatile CBS 122367]|uniref:Uncharacterized protein n=1 Tax=Lentithecium fluviatile CBS 122367 TaxID=1168545 RepID=A0A6G1IBQ7_9PLEO|nr:hypothetical protein K458DRAFT_397764 [Lentithecium fluviatile CBS 122367]